MANYSTSKITVIAILSGFALFAIAGQVLSTQLVETSPTIGVLLVAVALLIVSLPGIIFIIRQEAPTRQYGVYVSGKEAVLSGVFWLLITLSPLVVIINRLGE